MNICAGVVNQELKVPLYGGNENKRTLVISESVSSPSTGFILSSHSLFSHTNIYILCAVLFISKTLFIVPFPSKDIRRGENILRCYGQPIFRENMH